MLRHSYTDAEHARVTIHAAFSFNNLVDTCVCFLSCCRRRGGSQAKGHSAKHRDGAGRGDAQPHCAPGQPRVHWGQHEQLRLRGKVSPLSNLALLCSVCASRLLGCLCFGHCWVICQMLLMMTILFLLLGIIGLYWTILWFSGPCGLFYSVLFSGIWASTQISLVRWNLMIMRSWIVNSQNFKTHIYSQGCSFCLSLTVFDVP